MEAAGYVRRLLAVYGEAEDLINVGAYAAGSNRDIDEAISKLPAINAFLRQSVSEKVSVEDMREQLLEILSGPGSQVASDSPSGEIVQRPPVNSVSAFLGRQASDA